MPSWVMASSLPLGFLRNLMSCQFWYGPISSRCGLPGWKRGFRSGAGWRFADTPSTSIFLSSVVPYTLQVFNSSAILESLLSNSLFPLSTFNLSFRITFTPFGPRCQVVRFWESLSYWSRSCPLRVFVLCSCFVLLLDRSSQYLLYRFILSELGRISSPPYFSSQSRSFSYFLGIYN